MKLYKDKIHSSNVVITFVVALVVWVGGYLYILHDKNDRKQLYLEKQTVSQRIAWDSISNMYKIGMEAYFDMYINTPEVKKLLAVSNESSEMAKAKARYELFRLLEPVYLKLQSRNVRQLHFHDRNNNSFLRFHQPHNFGDSLNTTRPSVVLANRYKSKMQGFETGRVVSGFRNVFVIMKDGEHIGSVELSQPFEAMRSELKKLDQSRELMIVLRASEILGKIFEEDKKYYTRAGFSDDWLIEDTNGIEGGKRALSDESKKICKAVKGDTEFKRLMDGGKPFSYDVESFGKKYVITATPIKDIEGHHAATLLSFVYSPDLEMLDSDFRVQIAYFTVMLSIAAAAMYWALKRGRTISAERKRLNAISNTMGEGLYVIDVDGRIDYINEAALKMLGLKMEESIGIKAHYLFHSHGVNINMPLRECPIYRTIQTGEMYKGIDSFVRKNGETFYVDVISSPLKDEDEIIGSVIVFGDITDRLKLEESLREANEKLEGRVESEVARRLESEAIFKTIFDSSPEGILIINEGGKIENCNKTAASMLGFEPSEIIGKKPCELSPDVQPESGFFCKNAQEMFIQRALDGDEQHFEWVYISKDGSYRMIEVILSRITRIGKRELLALWRDVTNLREIQKERESTQALLIQQSKLAEMGAMVGAIAHQWKQPLNAIWLMTQDLKMSYDYGELDSELMERFKNDMGEQVKFMTQTINDFRNFYKPSTVKTKFKVASAIRSVLSLLKGQPAKDEIELVVELDESVFVFGFESEFKQVVLNIISNARDALSSSKVKNKIVNIKLFSQNGFAKVQIGDNGGGIDEKLLTGGKLFEPYSTTKGESGTGIGLSLGKTIIEKKMHGKLEAKNSEDGALFTIELALARE